MNTHQRRLARREEAAKLYQAIKEAREQAKAQRLPCDIDRDLPAYAAQKPTAPVREP